jgi:cholesterol transport system auxiliary component
MMNSRSLLLALGTSLALSGCISFGSKPPPFLLRLTPAQEGAAGTVRTAAAGQAITVNIPIVSQELMTPRVPVHSGANQLAYLKDAQWVEMPASLFSRLVSETISVRTGRVVLDPRQFSLNPGLRLTGTLQSFGLDADRMEAVVVYDAVLARSADSVQTRRFAARVSVAALDGASAATALNQAANQVATEVASWVSPGSAPG